MNGKMSGRRGKGKLNLSSTNRLAREQKISEKWCSVLNRKWNGRINYLQPRNKHRSKGAIKKRCDVTLKDSRKGKNAQI